MHKINVLANAVPVSKSLIEFVEVTGSNGKKYLRIFLTADKQALVEVSFEGEFGYQDNAFVLYSWDNLEGGVDSEDKRPKLHPEFKQLAFRGRFEYNNQQNRFEWAYQTFMNNSWSLTEQERPVFNKIVHIFAKLCRSNSLRFILD